MLQSSHCCLPSAYLDSSFCFCPSFRPPLGEALKWGWVQFLAAFIAVWWLASWFEWAVFRFRILETRVVSDVQQQRAHKF